MRKKTEISCVGFSKKKKSLRRSEKTESFLLFIKEVVAELLKAVRASAVGVLQLVGQPIKSLVKAVTAGRASGLQGRS